MVYRIFSTMRPRLKYYTYITGASVARVVVAIRGLVEGGGGRGCWREVVVGSGGGGKPRGQTVPRVPPPVRLLSERDIRLIFPYLYIRHRCSKVNELLNKTMHYKHESAIFPTLIKVYNIPKE